MSFWKRARLKSVDVTFIDGDRSKKYPKRSEFQMDGVLFLNTAGIDSGHIDFDSMNFITQEKFDSIQKGRIRGNDIIMTMRGAGVGNVALYPVDGPDGLINAQMLIIRAGTQIDSLFLYNVLRSPLFQEQLKLYATGSAQPQLSVSALRETVINLPDSLTTQRRIASILSAYDEVIENNHKRIKILEKMVRMLYQEWFVHFRFPGHKKVKMVDSSLGKIPDGWEVVTVGDFGRVITGKTPNKKKLEYYGNHMPFVKTPSMHGKIYVDSVEEYLSEAGAFSQNGKTLPTGTPIVNCIGALAGSVALTTEPCQTNQQINAVVLNEATTREFLYFSLCKLRDTIRNQGSTGATMINLSKGKFEALFLVRPEHHIMESFHDLAAPVFMLIRNAQLKNNYLHQARDLLLPKLISGEIDVGRMDIKVER